MPLVHYTSICVCLFPDGERNGQDGLHSSLSLWKPVNPRFLGFPYGSHIQDRSMYSVYGSLLGLNGGNMAALPSLSLSPFTAGTLTSTSSLAGYGLLAASASAAQSSESTSPNNNSIYHSALYGQRYHPYLPLASATTAKRPAAATSPALSIQ